MVELLTIFTIFGALVIVGILFGFAVYGFILWKSKKQYAIAYVDKYKQLVNISKLNCPYELREKKLIKAPDKNFSGITIGYIYGKNFTQIKNKWYHLFVICTKKKRIYDPFSWGVPDRLAVVSKEKMKMADDFNVKWLVGGLDYEGFFIFEVESDLTPQIIFRKTSDIVGIKEANLALKRTSKLVEEATESNPIIKATQKTTTEVSTRER